MVVGLALLIAAVVLHQTGRARAGRARDEWDAVEVTLMGRDTETRRLGTGTQVFHYWVVMESGRPQPRRVRVERRSFQDADPGDIVSMWREPRTGRLHADVEVIAGGWTTAAVWVAVFGAVVVAAAFATG